MGKIQRQTVFLLFLCALGFSQPYTDIAGFSYQHFSSSPKADNSFGSQTDQYALNLFFPQMLSERTLFLFRINSELIHSTVPDLELSQNLTGISVPVGFQFSSQSKKWATTVLVIPKLASDFRNNLATEDWQYGGLFLENFTPTQTLKVKAGLYYNREAFGNFFVPLLGIDWKATNRLYFYGTLPTNYKIEYELQKDKWYTGFDFKSVTRSFHLSGTDDYVRFDETLLKLFAECFVYKKMLLTGQIGYAFGKSPLQYNSDEEAVGSGTIYTPQKNYPVFNLGISYRLRNDKGK